MGVQNQPLWTSLTPRKKDFWGFFLIPQEELRGQKAHCAFNGYFILGMVCFSFHINDKYWL